MKSTMQRAGGNMKYWLSVLLIISFGVAAHAGVYKCSDGNGGLSFQSMPCKQGVKQTEIKQTYKNSINDEYSGKVFYVSGGMVACRSSAAYRTYRRQYKWNFRGAHNKYEDLIKSGRCLNLGVGTSVKVQNYDKRTLVIQFKVGNNTLFGDKKNLYEKGN